MEYRTSSTDETKQIAVLLANQLHPKDVLLLQGDLGSGKTTFTRFLVEALGFSDKVQSPTFVLARVYKTRFRDGEIKKVNHLDLYRLTSKEEALGLDLENYFEDSSAITIIEWPDVLDSLIPANAKVIKFEYLDEFRRILHVQNNN